MADGDNVDSGNQRGELRQQPGWPYYSPKCTSMIAGHNFIVTEAQDNLYKLSGRYVNPRYMRDGNSYIIVAVQCASA